MLRDDLIKAIKKVKGPIYVAVNSRHDTFYIQAVKSDLLMSFGSLVESEETYMALEYRQGNYYFDRDNRV
jgi:hypothetical protein